MSKPIIYPIGEQDFANIRNSGMVYVDKTDMVFSLVKTTQTARDLNAAKDHARELQRQLDELRNKKNKGCFGVLIGVVAITAATFASLLLVLL